MTFSTLGTMASYVPKQGVTGTVDLSTATVVKGAGMDLITPTSVVGATLSGGQVTFSASTEVDVNGCFTSAYDNYVVKMLMAPSAIANVGMRMRVAGANATAANYNFQVSAWLSTSGSGGRTTGATSWSSLGAVDAAVEQATTIDFFSPFLSSATSGMYTAVRNGAGSSIGINLSTFAYNASTSFDGFALIPSSGNITGTLRIYGLRNS